MVDALDSKSSELWLVRVRVSPSAPTIYLKKSIGYKVSLINMDDFAFVGTVAQSSVFLAKQMAKYTKKLDDNAKILEIGAGKGPITKYLVDNLKPNQHLDVVEIMPEFYAILEKKFSNKKNVSLYCIDILKFKNEQPYDLIICSLPFNSIEPSITEQIMDLMPKIIKKNAVFSFFEYAYVHKIVSYFLNRKTKIRYKKSRKLIENFIQKYEFEHTYVYMNAPPAIVRFLKFK